MAEAIALAIEQRGQLLAEAGTGTGKTFAYLVPALLSGGKVIISTGTKTLQDQLFQRDLPLIRDALKVPVSVALLKGRGNYVCHHHLERASSQEDISRRAPTQRTCRESHRFARTSTTGDKSELADVPENAAIWADVTSTRENCLGSECADYDRCFVMNARKQALAADVVVINHHLFFADVMLKDEGPTELLPACNTVILDEAHQLPDTATLFFGEEISAGSLGELARDAEIEGLRSAARLHAAARCRAGADAGAAPVSPRRGRRSRQMAAVDGRATAGIRARARRAGVALAGLARELAQQAERSDELAQYADRAADSTARLTRWREGLTGCADASDAQWIRWLEVSTHGWQLRASPLSVAEIFSRQVTDAARAWIFTSATLAIGGDFALYQRELGLGGATTGYWESPFDYAQQGLLYLPRDLPPPNSIEHTEAVVAAALPVLKASGGRAFLLFTTLRALARARESLAAAMEREGMNFPLLVQGEGSRVGVADALPTARQRRAARQPEFLGRRRRSRRSAVGGHHRQAAVRAAGRSPVRGPPRAHRARRRQSVHGLPVAAGRDQPEAGRGTADPLRDRPRRADDLRSRDWWTSPMDGASGRRCRRCGARASWPTWRHFSRRCRRKSVARLAREGRRVSAAGVARNRRRPASGALAGSSRRLRILCVV